MKQLEYLYELKPQYDSAKSFYKKANVYRNDKGSIFLMSYETIVAEIQDAIITIRKEKQAIVYDWYSKTTARHINEFLQQYGFDKMSKKEMEGGMLEWQK